MKFLLTIPALIFALSLESQAVEIGATAGSFLRLGLGADRVAMGDAGSALSGGSLNWYYNPAGLAFNKVRQATIGYRVMSLDRSMFYADYAFPLQGNAALSFGFLRAAVTDIDARDSNGRNYDMLDYSDNLLHASFSLSPHRKFAFGISIKWLIASAPKLLVDDKTLYSYGMGIDLGIQYLPVENIRFGLLIRDINAKMNWNASDVWADGRGAKDDNLPKLFRVGAAWDPVKELTIAVDGVINADELGNSSDAFALRTGVEWRRIMAENKLVAARVGFKENDPAFGIGLGMNLRRSVAAKLDYAYVLDSNSPGGSHLIGWTFGF